MAKPKTTGGLDGKAILEFVERREEIERQRAALTASSKALNADIQEKKLKPSVITALAKERALTADDLSRMRQARELHESYRAAAGIDAPEDRLLQEAAE